MGVGQNDMIKKVDKKSVVESVLSIAGSLDAKLLLKDARAIFGDELRRLLQERALEHQGNLSEISVSEGDGSYYAPIESQNGKNVYFSSVDAWVPVDEESIAVYKVNFSWLLRRIMDALQIGDHHNPKPIMAEFIWALDSHRIEGKLLQLIVVRRVADDEVYRALNTYLSTRHPTSSPALIIALDAHVPEHFVLPHNNRILLIHQAGAWLGDKFELNGRILVGAMGSSPRTNGFSADYRSLHIDGVDHVFTLLQAKIMEVLHNAAGPMYQREILAEVESSQTKLLNVFRGGGKTHAVWGTIIVSSGKGYYSLKL